MHIRIIWSYIIKMVPKIILVGLREFFLIIRVKGSFLFCLSSVFMNQYKKKNEKDKI